MYLEIFLADFAVFRVFWEFRGISRKYLNFAGTRPREISEALSKTFNPFKGFQSDQMQRSSLNIFTAHYAYRNAKLNLTPVKETTNGFIFSNNKFMNTIFLG